MTRRKTWLMRLVYFFFTFWMGLTLIWLFLPSPAHDDDCITLPSKLLNEHKEFTRIYETARFFPPSPSPAAGPQHPSIALAHALDRRHFALSFTIDSARQYLIINNQQRIAIQNANALERFSAPIPITAPVGDPSSAFPFPPWFHPADATLLSWRLRPETTVLTLRASWSASGGGPMEIWPDGDSWERRWLPPRGVRPLLTVNVVHSEIPNHEIIASAPPLSWSPSPTFDFRAKVFGWLFPMCFLMARLIKDGCCGVWVAGVVFTKALLGLGVLGLVAWLLEGRPEWGEFVEELRKDAKRICCQWGCCAKRRKGAEKGRSKNQSVDLMEKGHGILGGKEKG